MFWKCPNIWMIHLPMWRWFSNLQSVYICLLPTLLNVFFFFSGPGLKVVGSIQLHYNYSRQHVPLITRSIQIFCVAKG